MGTFQAGLKHKWKWSLKSIDDFSFTFRKASNSPEFEIDGIIRALEGSGGACGVI